MSLQTRHEKKVSSTRFVTLPSFESKEKLQAYPSAWQQRRNKKLVKANWQFTNKGARAKLAKF